MRKQIIFLLPLLVTAILFQRCTKTPCVEASLSFGLVSFSEAEADTIIMRRYNKGQNFTVLKDSFLLQISYTRSHDTLNMATFYGQIITGSFDFELYFPGAAKLYRITDIVEEQKEIRHAIFSNVKVGCENNITSLKINNQAVIPSRFNYFYLVR